jgi:hypothetical protein
MSTRFAPRPSQKIFKPPPVPVDSTTGVLKPAALPNCSATAVEKGNTVDDPTMRIWSRAAAGPQAMTAARAAAANWNLVPVMILPPREGLSRNGQPGAMIARVRLRLIFDEALLRP